MEGLKLLFVFVLMMVLLWRRVPLFHVMLGGSVLLALLYYTSPGEFLGMTWRATVSRATLRIEIILILVMVLEKFFGRHGYQEKMLKGLRGLIRDRRVVMSLLPVFIGLMPSPGGALFSCPMVNQVAAKSATPEDKAFANYYYRHIWEYFLPLYPGILLASQISEIPLPKLILAMIPYGLLVLLFGVPAMLKIPSEKEHENFFTDRKLLFKDLWTGIIPIVVLVGLVLMQVEVALSLALVLGGMAVYHRYSPAEFWRVLRESLVIKTLLVVWGIMVFKQVLVETHAVDGLAPLMAKMPVPEFVIFGLISFMAGLMTGLTLAYVGIAFPFVVAASGGQVSIPLAVFVFIAGFTGYMLTPVHLCLVLTVDYFKADMNRLLRKVAGPEFALLAAAVIGYIFL